MDNKIIKLDLKDKRLLLELDFNARDPYSVLARKLGISKQATEYRLNKLIEKKVIEGFYPVINCQKLGYHYCRLMIVLQKTNPQKEKEIIEYFQEESKFFWVFTTQGTFDLLAAMWAERLSDFRKEIDKLLSRYGEFIKIKHESFAIDVIHYQNRYFLNKKETKEIHIQESEEKIDLDETEKQILESLCENARTSIIKIADKLKISPKTVANKIKKLEKERIIEGYRPIVNHLKAGYIYYKLWINIQPGEIKNLNKLYDYIKSNPSVLYVIKGVGLVEDLDVEIMIKNNLELFEFIKELRARFPSLIGDYKSIMFEDTKKVRYLPF